MTLEDKSVDQAQAYRLVASYDALPLAGPGRWAQLSEGLIMYTNDGNILWAVGDMTTNSSSYFAQARHKLFNAGKTASEAFDILRLDAPAVSGDLSSLAE